LGTTFSSERNEKATKGDQKISRTRLNHSLEVRLSVKLLYMLCCQKLEMIS